MYVIVSHIHRNVPQFVITIISMLFIKEIIYSVFWSLFIKKTSQIQVSHSYPNKQLTPTNNSSQLNSQTYISHSCDERIKPESHTTATNKSDL
jgi:hypothetical protein